MKPVGPESCPIHGREGAERIERRIPGPLRRYVLLTVGVTSVGLGLIGIVVPLLPTTCFLLLAAWCFARSSPRMYDWLHENALFGEYLRQYRDYKVISPRVRSASLVVLWAFITVSLVLVGFRAWALALLLIVGVAVTAHLLRLRTEIRPDARARSGA